MNSLFFIFVILIEANSILSQSSTCAVFDFNDPLTLSEFEDCSTSGSTNSRLIIESYSNSSTFLPFRQESQYYLTTNKSVNSDITQCLSSKATFSGNFSSFSFQIGINLRNNNDTDQYNNVQLFVSDLAAFQINLNTNGWHLYEKNYSLPHLGVFSDSVIGLKVRVGRNSDLAVEFIKLYDPQITDKDCIPLYFSSTSPPEITTEDTTTTETESTTTESTTAEITTAESTTIESTTTESTTTESTTTQATETETPTTTEAENSTTEIVLPVCLDVDFNDPTSLLNTFKECHLQYLPELIIKSYQDTTITPYRPTSQFHLSNKWEGYSCLESTSTFSLVESSFIESVIFLDGAWPGAWIELSVVDIQTGEGEVLKRLGIENNWIRFYEEIKGKYNNAQVIIKTNMNAYSQLAVEYLNIRGDSC